MENLFTASKKKIKIKTVHHRLWKEKSHQSVEKRFIMPTESVKCDILFNFDNSQRVITSGQTLSGQVTLTFFKPKYLLGKKKKQKIE